MSSKTITPQVELPLNSSALTAPTPLGLLEMAIQGKADIGVIERVAVLVEKERDYQAELEFNRSLNRCQLEIPRIVPHLDNTQTNSKYASYTALDKVVRPIYLREGLSLSFSTDDCPKPEHERVICYVSHSSGHTRKYMKDIPADGKGPKGAGVMSLVHASGAASSYGMRYLLKMIFNIAIGEDDNDGNGARKINQKDFDERIAHFSQCHNMKELDDHFKASYEEAKSAGDKVSMMDFIQAKADRREALNKK